jgi:hypothetical protein
VSAIVLMILDTKKRLKAVDILIKSTGMDVTPTYDVILASIGRSIHYVAVTMFIHKTLSRWSRRDTEAITVMLVMMSVSSILPIARKGSL